MQDRLIERIEPDRYVVIDRYETSGDTPGRIDHYTVTLFDAQYLGPHSFDRDGLRLTFAPRGDGRLHAQRLTRRADRLGDELRAEPSLNLQRGCRCIEYAAADVPDPAELTQMLELAEPVSLDPIR
jgi:hypothetical protein